MILTANETKFEIYIINKSALINFQKKRSMLFTCTIINIESSSLILSSIGLTIIYKSLNPVR